MTLDEDKKLRTPYFNMHQLVDALMTGHVWASRHSYATIMCLEICAPQLFESFKNLRNYNRMIERNYAYFTNQSNYELHALRINTMTTRVKA